MSRHWALVNLIPSCSGFGRYQAVETIVEILPPTLSELCCSGFGRYQAVETFEISVEHQPIAIVAVGLAAIRPLKLSDILKEIQDIHKLQWVWPLSGR